MNGSIAPVFHTDDFILKVIVVKVTDKLPENNGKVARKVDRKNSINGDKLTENKIARLTFMIEDPYISKSDLSKFVGISTAAISNNIEAICNKYLRRVGLTKVDFGKLSIKDETNRTHPVHGEFARFRH